MAVALMSAVLGAQSLAPTPVAIPVAPATATLVLAARAYDRGAQLDSARAAYDAAATEIPALADWLHLRAAGVTADSEARSREYSLVLSPTARARIPWTEAQARERCGDLMGAARAYETLGAHTDALRARVMLGVAGSDSAQHAATRAEVVAFITLHSGTSDARAATELADRLFAPLTLDEERVVSRSASVAGPLTRAASGFERLEQEAGAAALTADDRYAYGVVLSRLHRDLDAARVLAADTAGDTPAAVAHASQYQVGRALVASGDTASARRVLRRLVRRAPRDTAAGSALMLLADLASDTRHDAAARRAFLEIEQHFASSPIAPRARFRAALIAFVAGSSRAAADEWDALVRRYPRADDVTAARYWSGRAWVRAGRPKVGADRWRAVLATDPLSYYATLSARRLQPASGLALSVHDTAMGALPSDIDSALARGSALETLGMATEARFEFDHAVRGAAESPSATVAVGSALVRIGEASRAVALGWRLVGQSDSAWRDDRILRLLYPLPYGDTLARDARARGLDPALVAAIVRQESAFNPRAISVAGARGLMQVMPAIGRALARSQGIGPWDPALLDEPRINLALGVAHLAAFQAEQKGSVVRTLAAYNAGPSRVSLWAAKRGADDPEIFVERIPFTETRDYVRAIVRGRDVYAALYGL